MVLSENELLGPQNNSDFIFPHPAGNFETHGVGYQEF